jgi:ABC-2 type transport system permease protein
LGKLWLVARFEYVRTARKRSFLVGMLIIPVFFGAIVGVGAILVSQGDELDALGYVDEPGVLRPDAVAAPTPRAYADERSARAALERDDIKGYYVLPSDYLVTRGSTLVYGASPVGDSLRGDFNRFVQASLAAQLPPAERDRLDEGFQVTLRSADGTREIDGQSIFSLIVPIALAFLFMFAGMATGGYVQQAVSDEREGRTVELLATSVSADQLIVGKTLGLVAAAMTQLLVWALTAVVTLLIAASFIDEIKSIEPPVDLIGLTVLFFVPSFLLVAGIMIVVGSVVADQRQGQQFSAIVNMLFVLPLFFISLILETPDSPVAVALTIFPTTSMVTIAMRWELASIPWWQITLALSLLLGAAGAAIWVAPRVFRVGMLSYGQRLAPRHISQAVRLGGR